MIPFSRVRQEGLLVVGDDVLDIGRFTARHPGGPELGHLRGSDGTLALINAHGVRGELPPMPKKLVIGTIATSTLPATDRDLRRLWAEFRARGLFEYRAHWFVIDVMRSIGLFTAGLLALRFSAVVAFVLLVVATLDVMWWVHDACHDSVFRSRAAARRWAELVSLVCVGTSVIDYQYIVHRIHHGFTNTLDADRALETGPVVWHSRMRARTSNAFIPYQAWIWFAVVLPLTLPYFMVIGVRSSIARKRYTSIVAMVVRWAVVAWLLGDHLLLVVAAGMTAAYVLGLTASLNHFHRPITERASTEIARSVTRATQNLTATGRVSSWLLGGLSFHIEHHLFATMPRRNYRVIAPEIRAFCTRHGLSYDTVSYVEAVGALWRKLRDPYAITSRPIRPSLAELSRARLA